jgi:hypothetical protein
MGLFNTKGRPNIPFDALQRNDNNQRKLFKQAVVKQVFYDFQKGSNENRNFTPGTISARLVGGQGGEIIAYPIDESSNTLPLINETVEIFLITSTPFYRRVTVKGPSLNTSALIVTGQSLAKGLSSGVNSKPLPTIDGIDSYKNASVQTNSVSDSNSKLGNQFKKETIHRLRLFEGDTITQSRFGQSIRFSSYYNNSKKSYPITFLRNGESLETKDSLDETLTVLEDINKDGGTIFLGSGKFISEFIPGSVDRNKKSNFRLKVWENKEIYALEQYPKKLDGNQIIITSDRLILSSRVNELMLMSKGVLSLVADSYLSLDAYNGMNFVSQKGDLQFSANDLEMKFFVGKKGKIHLAADKDSPTFAVINGKELTDLIGELVNEIIKICKLGGVLTPAGPSSGMNPANEQALKTIMSKLPGTLSKRVFVGM